MANNVSNPNISYSSSKCSESHTFVSFTTNLTTPRFDESGAEDEGEILSYTSDTSWPDIEIPGSWGTYGLEENPWNDETKPYVKIRTYEELELNDLEQSGVLTERIVACCSSYLDRSPIIGKYVLCKTNLCKKNLRDISVLTYHHYLQYLNLSCNKLTSLTPLGELPYLMYLDASHNFLTEVLNFKPPLNLTFVNLSYNYVDVIDDLSNFWSLIYLDLSHNQIYYIKGLDKLKYLRFLDLSYNKIKELRNLNRMKLVNLNLQNNKIEKAIVDEDNGLYSLKELVAINLSNNRLKTLKMFENVDGLQKLIMSGNSISHLIELEHLKNLRFLTEVDLRNNPFCKQKRYYEMCIKLIKPLVLLDGSYITSEEKVLVKCKHDPPPLIDAARKRSNLFLLEKLMRNDVTTTTLPIQQPVPPIIILVAPPGSGQRFLLSQFAKKYQKYLKVGITHTTRPKRDAEEEGVEYYFISDDDFKRLTKEGQFMAVSDYMGYSYGIHRDELAKVYHKNLVFIFHTDLISALILRLKSLRPILVLTLCYEDEGRYQKLVNNLCYTKWKSLFKDNVDVFRISVKGISEEERNDLSSSNSKEFYEDVVSFLPLEEKFLFNDTNDTTTMSRGGEETSSKHSGQTGDSTTRKVSVSYRTSERSDKAVRSISEQEMVSGYEPPVLSALSAYFLESDDQDDSTASSSFEPNKHVEKFIAEVMETRRRYVEFHQENTGFFTGVVYTDRQDEAMLTLKGILKYQVESAKKAFYAYNYETDPCFGEILTDRLNALYTEMYGEMFVSEDQQPKCWKKYKLRDLDE